MKISVKCEYACRAVTALAMHYPSPRPLRIDEIAQRQDVPANYLVQILSDLRGGGLIQSRRGKSGGYLLARSPDQITVGDVLRAVNGEVVELSTLMDARRRTELQKVWARVRHGVEQIVDDITFDEICARTLAVPQMYYI